MFVETVLPEKLAMLVHYYSEALAPDFGCRPSGSPDWGDVSQQDRNRIVAATGLALLDLRSEHSQRAASDPPPVSGVAGGSEGKECGC
jgi:hypothetical protein